MIGKELSKSHPVVDDWVSIFWTELGQHCSRNYALKSLFQSCKTIHGIRNLNFHSSRSCVMNASMPLRRFELSDAKVKCSTGPCSSQLRTVNWLQQVGYEQTNLLHMLTSNQIRISRKAISILAGPSARWCNTNGKWIWSQKNCILNASIKTSPPPFEYLLYNLCLA